MTYEEFLANPNTQRNFPKLTTSNSAKTSPIDENYNCIAWAAEDDTRWWWPNGGYWPSSAPNVATDASFKIAYATLGYAISENGDYESGIQKIAVYLLNDVPTHASRQLSPRLWTSKLGSGFDISHEFDALNGPFYGEPEFFMARSNGVQTT